jgi:antibiotic biosynthesis monooxygenase (ABM) superfamily enzyme
MPTPKQAPTQTPVRPPRHKMALVTWAGAWALITLILWLLGPVTATWPLPLRTLVISVLMVLGLTWVVIPYLTRLFAGWLAPKPTRELGLSR